MFIFNFFESIYELKPEFYNRFHKLYSQYESAAKGSSRVRNICSYIESAISNALFRMPDTHLLDGYSVPTNIDLFIKLLKHESEVNTLGFVGERQMFEDVVKKEMLFEHSQKKTNGQGDSLGDRVSK